MRAARRCALVGVYVLCLVGAPGCGDDGGPVEYPDDDGDGYTVVDGDCDDTDPDVHPGATEVCNGVDDDCSGGIDDGVAQPYFIDEDGDGYGVDSYLTTVQDCAPPSGYADNPDDCDDADPDVHPGATEVCNGVDDDCSGVVDDGVAQTFYWDDDRDGFGVDDPATNTEACAPPLGYTDNADDCDDTDAAVNPDATEVCNGIDDNCDGDIDLDVGPTWYVDGDADGVGVDDATTNVQSCTQPTGFVSTAGDCDDNDATRFPGNPEVCDGVDNDCVGGIDDGLPLNIYYEDFDGDGAGNDSVTQLGCMPPATGVWVLSGGDCDDNDATRFPGNPDVCDGIDNDCDPATPEIGSVLHYYDGDGDGYGDENTTLLTCMPQPAPWMVTGGDCDDTNPAVHPGAPELCDYIDNNCVDGVDEGGIATWPDVDNDGFGDAQAAPTYLCEIKPWTAGNDSDCNDLNPLIKPGAPEIPGNGIDENCDGTDATLGGLCGYDSLSATALPFRYSGALSSGDQVDNGPKGTGYYWDDVEVATTLGQNFTILYHTDDPANFRPQLYTYGPNSCTTLYDWESANSYQSPRGLYMAYHQVLNADPGYYYSVMTTAIAGQLGDYQLDILPGELPTSCGSDYTFVWPLGWHRVGNLSTFDTQSTTETPIQAGFYADDYEFYLEAGTAYSLLVGMPDFSERLVLARAGACDVALMTSNGGLNNGGARMRYTPTESDVYVAYVTTQWAGDSGNFLFNVVEGDLGYECFDGPGSIGGNGDPSAIWPLIHSYSDSLSATDRAGDFGNRMFDDRETHLEVGDQVTITMTRTTGTFRPSILLTRAGDCTTPLAQADAPAAGTTATLNYTATENGIYAIVFTSVEENEVGNYDVTVDVL